ncbi:phosphopentomutase [Octadecabacter temperatus]|uniref:Phosphopentomutase n=1 Tax=Octadecabacter temperatus TaxID=1458307 RepID=A0A0K0Y7J0_9RHOB|nr:phosphopentomutase [Octadecabacter temperatus]AKS46832.1 Phosphopentomutase [Octadecabacter temperatus]SIO22132.1 phosphopentomutase [Octadecabacter temperatus]
MSQTKNRAFLVVIDSVGIGGAPDAADFFNGDTPDTGANTLGHIAQACAAGQVEDGRTGPLKIPTLNALGAEAAMKLATGLELGWPAPTGAYASAREVSIGKDTPSGHWELSGVPVPWDWHTFPDTTPTFPDDVTARICALAGTDGILANCHASGVQVIDDFGAEHIRTGWPICYTSVDSVLQIAAHEEHFGLDRLLKLCQDLAPMLHDLKVGRVIARPFVGEEGKFERTLNRHDYAIAPPSPTLCDWAENAGRSVQAIGKIGDIFSMRGIDEVRKGADTTLMEHLSDMIDTAPDGGLVFANFVEFDSLYGHRRDVSGYARHLEWFDAELAKLLPKLRDGDMLCITADHGNDPTWVGTDHTREQVPVLVHGIGSRNLGQINFVDVAASIATHLSIPAQGNGRSFL